MTFSQDLYIEKAQAYGHSEEFINLTVDYAKNLLSKNLPVIFSTEHLALLLNLEIEELKYIIEKREEHYKFYQIKKKNGKGFRQIIAPHNNLREIQQFINVEILNKIEIHSQSKGFIKGKSILDNAKPHENKQAILNIDLLKFFDSISEKRVFGIFKSMGYSTNLCVDLAKLTTVRLPDEYFETFSVKELKSYKELVPENSNVLPQGAPTSPTISNLVLRRLDNRLNKLAEKQNVEYTRYADDITFSGEVSKLPQIKLLRHIIRDEGFCINWGKVGIYKKGRKQMVTGLTVSNGTHIHRNFKKEVYKHIYSCLNFGVENHLKFLKIDDKRFYKEWLLGKIYFIKAIEPNHAKKMLNDFNKIIWMT
jgi:RNA-directed DNA polymerase